MAQEYGVAAFRISRLDGTGAPVSPGTDQAMAICDASSVEFTKTFSTGQEIEKRGGMGRLCFYRKVPDELKGGTFQATLCAVSWYIAEMIENGVAELLGGATPTGVAISTVQCGDSSARGGVFAEWWTENNECGTPDPETPYLHHMVGRWFANAEGGTFGSETARDYVFSGDVQTAVVNSSGAPGGPFGDWSDLTQGKAYLSASQDADTLPECQAEPIDTLLVS